jgi:uncharacterized damage-inducible protein DinB
MLDKDDAARLNEYTVWANHRAMRVAATLSVEQFRRDLGSSHGGVRGTLAHMLSAEWIWLERFKGVSPPRLFDEAEFPDVMTLRERWTVVEKHREAWFSGLRPEELGAEIRYQSIAGQERAAPLWHLLQHVANHSSYHRGQVTTLLRLLGAKPVSTDMSTWDYEREAKQARAHEG